MPIDVILGNLAAELHFDVSHLHRVCKDRLDVRGHSCVIGDHFPTRGNIDVHALDTVPKCLTQLIELLGSDCVALIGWWRVRKRREGILGCIRVIGTLMHHHRVRRSADAFKPRHHLALQTTTQRHNNDHCHNADNDAQQRQQRPKLVLPKRRGGKLD